MSLEVRLLGAAQEVTGSSTLFRHEYGKQLIRVLLDCGLFQGGPRAEEFFRNTSSFPYAPSAVDVALATHAHIDHLGRFPQLVRDGFEGDIHCAHPTAKLAPIMWEDTAGIQALEFLKYQQRQRAERNEDRAPRNSRGRADRQGREFKRPPRRDGDRGGSLRPYDLLDVEEATARLVEHAYREPFKLAGKGAGQIEAELIDAAHILGSAQALLRFPTRDGLLSLLHTGDLGNGAKMSHLGDPQMPDRPVDVVFTESTYGNREHEKINKAKREMKAEIKRALKGGGKVIVPAFALERTQEFLMALWEIIGEVNQELGFPVDIYSDSPMSQKINRVYQNELPLEQLRTLGYSNLHMIKPQKPGEINVDIHENKRPAIIISTSGMCEFGPIRDHLRAGLGDEKNLILFIGFPGHNTLAERIIASKKAKREDDRAVSIGGEAYPIRARVVRTDAFSAHADQAHLTRHVRDLPWRDKKTGRVVLVHGDLKTQLEFREHLLEKCSWLTKDRIIIPAPGEVLAISRDHAELRKAETSTQSRPPKQRTPRERVPERIPDTVDITPWAAE